jgi:hypothetical protein
MTYRYSPRVSFEVGDAIRLSGGPYFVSKTGAISKMGVNGLFKFYRVDDNGRDIWVKRAEHEAPKYVYMGPDTYSADTGTHFTAHKLKKTRKKKPVS